jgi:hypothetical protein
MSGSDVSRLGGATPLDAGRAQLLVLEGLLAAEAVAAAEVTALLPPLLPGPGPRDAPA